MGFIGDIIEAVGTQLVSNNGFEDGINGRAPTVYPDEYIREIYDRGYQLGLQAAQARLLSKIGNRIDQELLDE